jgi:hypothetical protein
MKTAKKTSLSLLTGLLVLLATLATPITSASAGNHSGNISTGIHSGNLILPTTLSDDELTELLHFASLEVELSFENIEVKIYGNNDDLIYSSTVCPIANKCDERLNQLINQSDFITEVDHTRIYILNQ